MASNLIIGSSHALHLAEQAGPFHATWEEASRDLIPLGCGEAANTQLLFVTPKPSFLEVVRGPDGAVAARFGPLIEKVRAFDREGATVVFAIGGNEHNIRFLCADPRAFDFHHPSHPVIDPARQVVPAREMEATLRSLLEPTLTATRLIAAEVPRARRLLVAPPPPIASEAYIRSHPAIFQFAANGVEDAGVRLKIYNLYNEILARFCAGAGLEFAPPPAEARDEAGFLREAYWNGSTHATPAYYSGLVAHLGL